MDRLRHMRALVTVAQLGSFSAAARELGVTPGMMSKQIKHLEDELDVRLLHRSTRGVSLTEAGELYVEHLIEVLQRIDDADETVTALAAGPRGVLRISCPPTFGTHVLTPAIAAFAAENPAIKVELGLQDDEPDVIASRLDVIFRLGELRDSSLVARQLATGPFVLVTSPLYAAQQGSPATLAELDRHNCIADASIPIGERWTFVHERRRVVREVTGNFMSHSTDAVIRAVRDGMGIAYVPRYAVAEELAAGQVLQLDLDGVETISIPLFALYGSRDHVAAKVGRFLEFCRGFIAARDDLEVTASAAVERRAHGTGTTSTDGTEIAT